jgi:hypothetical protein
MAAFPHFEEQERAQSDVAPAHRRVGQPFERRRKEHHHKAERNQYADDVKRSLPQVGCGIFASGGEACEERDQKQKAECEDRGERQHEIAGEVSKPSFLGLVHPQTTLSACFS